MNKIQIVGIAILCMVLPSVIIVAAKSDQFYELDTADTVLVYFQKKG